MAYMFGVRMDSKEYVQRFMNHVQNKKKDANPAQKVTMCTELLSALDLYMDVENNDVTIVATDQLDELIMIKKLAVEAGLLDALTPSPQAKLGIKKDNIQSDEIMYA